MSNTAYAVFNTSYELRTPYLTPTEFQNSPNSLDVNNLLPGGANAQVTALQEVIGRASSWIDQYCCGNSGTLCSTVETENARVWGSYRWTLPVHPKFWPCTEVQSFAYSPLPGGLASGTSASVTPAGNISIYSQEFEVGMGGSTQFFNTGITGFGGFGTTGINFRTEYDVQYTYVAGWPNTTLAASVSAGAASIEPSVVTGIYPGTQLTVYDLPWDEPVTVASTYVPGNSVVPLTAPLQYDHTATATVTNLPPAIKQAAILATTAFIKIRGSGALEVADMGAISQQTSGAPQGLGNDQAQAAKLLDPYKQNFVGW